MAETTSDNLYIELAADIVSAYLSHNSVPSSEIPNLINQIHTALKRVSTGQAASAAEPPKPAVPIKRSVTPEYIVCLEDGLKFKSLKRHLRTRYNLTPINIAKNLVCRPTIRWSRPIMRLRVQSLPKTWGSDSNAAGAESGVEAAVGASRPV